MHCPNVKCGSASFFLKVTNDRVIYLCTKCEYNTGDISRLRGGVNPPASHIT